MIECGHKNCVPRKKCKSSAGLAKHNAYVLRKAKLEGRHELTALVEAPIPSKFGVTSTYAAQNAFLLLDGLSSPVWDIPTEAGVKLSVLNGKIRLDGKEISFDTLVSCIRLAVVATR